MSTSTALKTSPSLNVPAAADAPVVKAPVRLAHPRCVLERIKRIQALEAPPRPAPAARTSSEGSASSSTPSTDVDEAWVDSVLSGGEAADPPTATKPLPSTATKRKSPEVEAEAEPAEKKPKPSPLRSRLAEAQLRARAAGRSDAVSWVYDENELLLGAKCDGDFFTRCAPPAATRAQPAASAAAPNCSRPTSPPAGKRSRAGRGDSRPSRRSSPSSRPGPCPTVNLPRNSEVC